MEKVCSKKRLCEDKDCQICFDKSFASRPEALSWSVKNRLSPRQVFKSAKVSIIFNCACGHEFETYAYNIKNNVWCPYCSPSPKKLCEDIDCKQCFEKSFASHPKSKFWSEKNIKKARDVFKNTHSKYLFNCNTCYHEIKIMVKEINQRDNWCPYCANQQLCKDVKCQICFDKSFASYPMSNFWSEVNTFYPRDVFKHARIKCLFKCDTCKKEFETTPRGVSQGTWCPYCINKTEQKLYNIFTSYGYEVNRQVRFNWCRNPETNRILPFDFVVNEYKIIIELDGQQHFKQVMSWRSPEDQQKIDKYKMQQALKHGYAIIRIYQPDVFNDAIDWVHQIEQHIYLHEIATVIYIASNDVIYDIYRKMEL